MILSRLMSSYLVHVLRRTISTQRWRISCTRKMRSYASLEKKKHYWKLKNVFLLQLSFHVKPEIILREGISTNSYLTRIASLRILNRNVSRGRRSKIIMRSHRFSMALIWVSAQDKFWITGCRGLSQERTAMGVPIHSVRQHPNSTIKSLRTKPN